MNKEALSQIFDKFPDPIFVTDRQGNVLLSNSTAAMTIGMSLDQFLKSNINDMIQKSYYNKSYAMEAVEKKCVVSGLLTTKLNFTMMSVSTPVLDENGDVSLVLTTGRPKDLLKTCSSQEEKEIINRRKREIDYLRNYVLESTTVVAESPAMRQLLLLAHRVAQADSTVLLYGESGVGKEVLAKYIHRHSKRAQDAFIAVNCASFPESLVESELFGYEKGAFTGADINGKVGLFEAAHQGTLFLDEIAELPLAPQSKLLRVLETNGIRRVGSNADRKIDFRLIAATNRDLLQMTEQGLFRKDLYYRLHVIPIRIPPLKERPEDIEALAMKFLADFNKQYDSNIKLNPDTLDAFKKHNWPGNVRELRNLIERTVICSLPDYPAELLALAAPIASRRPGQNDCLNLMGWSGTLKEVVGKFEEQYINQVLEECNGRIGETAKRLGIYRTVLYRKRKAFEQRNSE
ncbi:PAS modulated sigma54 specific transcriptional regulator, Fis family protein [Acetonema longum DSM 6540]|uniref:PAS modulated sigma54 specific transcriptional regulator, Fis family protein n=2 Tax=Acetonema TaxID=2373 RepID=F7NNZ5_9FIRM|nr:PAS modulated sigma54 specific transcriptional regulator, Fis family protein [Acetonema longum DSM 6540]